MRYLKMVGLLAVAAAALMAFTGSASAALATSPSGIAYTGTVKAVAESTLALVGDNFTVSCTESEVQGKITAHGKPAGTTVNASGPIEKLTFTGCNHHVEDPVVTPGALLANSKGEVFSSGAKVTITTTSFLGTIHCVYITANTKLGTVTDAPNATGHATLKIASAVIPVDPNTNTALCGNTATWTGNYKITSPTGFVID